MGAGWGSGVGDEGAGDGVVDGSTEGVPVGVDDASSVWFVSLSATGRLREKVEGRDGRRSEVGVWCECPSVVRSGGLAPSAETPCEKEIPFRRRSILASVSLPVILLLLSLPLSSLYSTLLAE